MKRLGRCGNMRRKKKRQNIVSNKCGCGETSLSQKSNLRSVSQSHFEIFIDLRQWMTIQFNIKARNLAGLTELIPAEFPETGRGLRAKKNYQPGEILVSIPVKSLITPHTVLNSIIGRAITRTGKQLTSQQLLTLFLLSERRASHGSWAAYLATMPSRYTTTLSLPPRHLPLLPPATRTLAQAANARFETAYAEMKAVAAKLSSEFYNKKSDAPDVTSLLNNEDEFKWAWTSVHTRCVYLKADPHPALASHPPAEVNLALAPFLDLLNHCHTAKVTAGLDAASQNYNIVTHNYYKKYDQVFISYGPHSNSKLAVDYGFTISSNVNNSVNFSLDEIRSLKVFSTMTEGEFERKCSIIEEAGLKNRLECTLEGISWPLLTTLKVFCLPWGQLNNCRRLIAGGGFTEAIEQQAFVSAKDLLACRKKQAQKHARMVVTESDPKSPHHDMLMQLKQDDLDILVRTQELLEIMNKDNG